MRFLAPNGNPIVGTLETLFGCANATEFSETGEPEYDGETTIWWDEQRTVHKGASMVYVDENGDQWTFDQLVPDTEDDEEEDDTPPNGCTVKEVSGGFRYHFDGDDDDSPILFDTAAEAAAAAHRVG